MVPGTTVHCMMMSAPLETLASTISQARWTGTSFGRPSASSGVGTEMRTTSAREMAATSVVALSVPFAMSGAILSAAIPLVARRALMLATLAGSMSSPTVL